MSFTYGAHGLTIHTPFACPDLLPLDPRRVSRDDDGRSALVVRTGPVPARLSQPWDADDWWEAEPGRFLLHTPDRRARFLVEGGAVTVQADARASHSGVAWSFTHSILATALHQRGLVVLHANAVSTEDGVIVVAGESGAGKSTTLAALLRRGCRMLSDDLTVLRPGGPDDSVQVSCGAAQLLLYPRCADSLGYREPAAARTHHGKTVVSTHDTMATGGPLRSMYQLTLAAPRDAAASVEATTVSGGAKFRFLQDCLYGPTFGEHHPAMFEVLRTVATTVPMRRLVRPTDRWCVDEVVDIILADTRHAHA